MLNFDEIKQNNIEIEPGMESFLPEEFKGDPIGYFKEKGVNIKSGEKTFKENREVSEDPDAVKDLPVWQNSEGEELYVVGKLINTNKSHVGKSGNPFYEFDVMKKIKEKGLPCANLVAKAEQNGEYLIIMEKVPGLRWVDKDVQFLKDQGLTEADLSSLQDQAWQMAEELSEKFTEAGIIRTWKPKDMIFEIDLENKKITKITPVDWERTKVEEVK